MYGIYTPTPYYEQKYICIDINISTSSLCITKNKFTELRKYLFEIKCHEIVTALLFYDETKPEDFQF